MKPKRHAVKRPKWKPRRTSKEASPSGIGQAIKHARTKANLTQLALAHAIGYQGDDAGACISRWENNEQAPTLENLSRIANALGVAVCSLLSK